MKALSIILGLAILSVMATSTASALSVAGVIFEQNVTPGVHVSHEINVSLAKDEGPMNITVDILDWRQTLYGVNVAVDEHGALSNSARSFFTASPSVFQLEKGGYQNVLISGTVPDDVKPGGLYAMFSVRSGAMRSRLSISMGIKFVVNGLIRLTVPGPGMNMSGVITNLSIKNPINVTEPKVSMIFNNTGNIHYEIAPGAVLEDNYGSVLANDTQPLSSNIIPGAARQVELSLKPKIALDPGIYTIQATASLSNGTALSVKSSKFEIK
jgi:hypothetical protein